MARRNAKLNTHDRGLIVRQPDQSSTQAQATEAQGVSRTTLAR